MTPQRANTLQQRPAFVDHCSDPPKRPPRAVTSSRRPSFRLHSPRSALLLFFDRHKMSEEPTQKYPAYKLGEYTVVGEIAEGTFGKVKSKHGPLHFSLCAS